MHNIEYKISQTGRNERYRDNAQSCIKQCRVIQHETIRTQCHSI